MTLDLLGSQSYFGSGDFGHDQQNAGRVMDTTAKAILYVFKPYDNQFGDVGLRPYMYNFDQNFLGEAQEVTDLARRGTATGTGIISELQARLNLNENMAPSFMPTMELKASHLSNRYRFILLLSEKASGLIGGNTIAHSNPNSQLRRIYTGFFEDEPFNFATYAGGRATLNPNAFMVITHKTVVGTMTEHGRFGSQTRLNTTASEEFIHPQFSRALMAHPTGTSGEIHLMTPENCINSIDTNEQGFSLALPGVASDITKDNGTNLLPDLLENPAQNVSQIMKGIIRFTDDVSNRNRLHYNRQDQFFEDSFGDGSIDRVRLGSKLALPRSRKAGPLDLDENQRISPVELDNLVSGDLEVQPFDLQRPMFYETADQMAASVTNQYSYLIASVISPILNAVGANAMTFEYQVARIAGEIKDDFFYHNLEPNWPVPGDDLRSMAMAVKTELVDGIFSTIFHSKGAFHVAVKANVAGMTVVRLSLVDQGYQCQVDFELPSCMGGLISPLLGDAASNAHNTSEIEGLFNSATGTSKVVNNFNQDDRDFVRLADNFQYDPGNDQGQYMQGMREQAEYD